MSEKTFNRDLFKFIANGSCSFTCINEIKKIFLKLKYKQLYENENWDLKPGRYFVIRNDSSLTSFSIGKNYKNSFNIVCTHSDTPGFILKPKNEINEYNYTKINVAPYGGILNYGWMDRPLSIAGRVICKEKNKYIKRIIDIKKNLCVIPSEAIHQNNEANTNLDLNTQFDLIPIISLNNTKNIIRKILNNTFKSKYLICDYDLFLYNNEKPSYIGVDKQMILSPRLDNLTCTFAAIKSHMHQKNDGNINVVSIFNSEEIGSLSKEGADSNFLIDTLKKICASLKIDISIALQNSILVCADNSHAVHPNHPDKSDISNQGLLNKGILIIRDKGSTTDSISSTIFKEICKRANVPYQDYTSRNDMNTGASLSGMSIRHISIDTIDVGISQLAMHSANELIGSKDTFFLYKALKKFYEISLKHNFNDIEILEKVN